MNGLKIKNRKLWERIIVILLFFALSLTLTACGKKVKAPVYDDSVMPAKEVEIFAIVCHVDEVNGKIKLRAVDFETEIDLVFSGGVDVKDKYGEILSMSQVELGSIVDVVYDANREKLLSLKLSDDDKVQKLEGMEDVSIHYQDGKMDVHGTVYKIDSNFKVFSDNKEIAWNEVCREDQLSLWLYNDIVYSAYVELGHGYVRLSDYAAYIGGMVEIGYDVIVPVTEDMLLTVREGDYTLQISKDENVGTKDVKVIKNQEIEVSLADLLIEPMEMGSVQLQIQPADANVYIDGKRVNPEGAIPLLYGKHRIYIVAPGYKSYSASFNVNYAYKIKEYQLVKENEELNQENSSEDEVSTENNTDMQDTEEDKNQEDTTLNEEENQEEIKDVNKAEGEKTDNKVTVLAPEGASVYFDGEYIGILPISFTKVTGSHIITLSKKGYLSKSYTVNFADDGKDVSLKYDDLISISSLVK